MGYFPNMTAWEFWAADNCFKCAHWPKGEDDPGCPVEMAHSLYCYELCNEETHPGKVILDMLIPETKDGLGNERCGMFRDRDGLSEKHLRDWQKYKEIMAARDSDAAQRRPAGAEAEGQQRGSEGHRHPSSSDPQGELS